MTRRTRQPLLLLALAACCARRASFEELQRDGYRALQEGQLESATARADEGLRRARETRQPAWTKRFEVLQAEILVEGGHDAEALRLLDAPVTPGARADPVLARTLMTRGRIHCLSGDGAEDLAKAATDLGEARRMAADLGASALAAEVARHQGTCALFQGDYSEAETRYRESLALARQDKQLLLEAKATNNIGLLKIWSRRYDEAADWLNKALDLTSRLRGDLDTVKTLTNLGWCYYNLGDIDRALSFLSRAEALAEARGYTAERAYALRNIGNVHYRLRALGTAAGCYRRALDTARSLGAKKLMAELLSNLGIVALEQGRYDEAEASVREAISIKAEIHDLPAMQHSLLAEGQISAARGNAAQAESLFRGVLASPVSTRELLWETRASLAKLRMEARRPAEAEAEFRKAFAIMDASRDELQSGENKISFFSSLAQFYDDYVGLLVAQGKQRRALEVADLSRARLLREMLEADRAIPRLTTSDFQAAARRLDAVILFYWLAPARSFVWAVTERNVELHELPGEDSVRKQVDAHQALILGGRDPLRERAKAPEWLYETLIGPVKTLVPPGSRVVLVPDGALHRLDFDTLVVPSPEPHYWIEDVTLESAPSISVLSGQVAAGVKPVRGPRSILLIGDPLPAGAEYPRLAFASRELRRIADRFPPSERSVYSGAQAAPSAYRRAQPWRFSLVHIAAHAQANREIPLESAVVLSPENERSKLYAREIASIPLHADLVTLSACRGAGSRTYAGEGLVGLTWAFLSSGARNVIAGLWSVEDASTAQLMDEMYGALSHGAQPPDALRAAKLALLRSTTAYRKPYYWAPFVVYTQQGGSVRVSGTAETHAADSTPVP